MRKTKKDSTFEADMELENIDSTTEKPVTIQILQRKI